MHLPRNMACELKQCCRICAQRNSDLISIFGEEGLFRQLILKLRYCLQIIVLESDNLPTTICWKCVSKLEVCFDLMQESVRGQNEFRRKMLIQEAPLNWEHKQLKMEDIDPEQETQKMYHEPSEEDYDTHHSPASSTECTQKNYSQHCQCEKCVSQYGSLPLLADVIDKNKTISEAGSSGSAYTASDKDEAACSQAATENKVVGNEGGGPIRVTRKTVSCEFCAKVFSHTGDLNKHRRRHTGERPYACTECDKRFSHTSNLLRHQKIHSGEMPHQCPTCDRRFSRKDKMVNHIKNFHCKPQSDTNS